MSLNEYSFHIRRKKPANPSIDSQPTQRNNQFTGKVKETILSQYDHFVELKKSNEKINHLSDSQEKISREITEAFGVLQKATDNEKIKQLNDKLNYLTALHKKIGAEYDEILKKELDVLYQNWPDIFEKIIKGIDRETLENVLTAYEEFQTGQISANQAVIHGMDYMTQKYNLPTDFFNKSAVDQFNKNMHKLS
jgi:hypothetical protein